MRILTALILTSALAAPLAAQQAQAPAALTVTSGEAQLPAALRGLGLTEIQIRPDDDNDGEIYINARNGAGWLRAEARGDRLEEVESHGAPLPAALIATILPAPVRAEPRLAEITQMTEIDLDDDGFISVEGVAADGMRIEIDIAPDGRLHSYERESAGRKG